MRRQEMSNAIDQSRKIIVGKFYGAEKPLRVEILSKPPGLREERASHANKKPKENDNTYETHKTPCRGHDFLNLDN